MTMPHLVLRFDAPMMSFGGVVIDNLGVSDAWPSASLLAGLIGNALGFRRTDRDALQDLQDRLVFACRADQEGEQLRDFQTAELLHREKGWTTRGQPEGREGRRKDLPGETHPLSRLLGGPNRHRRDADWSRQSAVRTKSESPRRLTLRCGLCSSDAKSCLPAAPLFVGWS